MVRQTALPAWHVSLPNPPVHSRSRSALSRTLSPLHDIWSLPPNSEWILLCGEIDLIICPLARITTSLLAFFTPGSTTKAALAGVNFIIGQKVVEDCKVVSLPVCFLVFVLAVLVADLYMVIIAIVRQNQNTIQLAFHVIPGQQVAHDETDGAPDMIDHSSGCCKQQVHSSGQ